MIRRIIIFTMLMAILTASIAALAYPHFRLALFVAFVVWIIWAIAGAYAQDSYDYDPKRGGEE